jgi:hypothetical protein
MKRLIPFTFCILLLCSASSFAQNTCAYNITEYNFCLTSSGTLYSAGFLNPSNPVEGWGLCYSDWDGAHPHGAHPMDACGGVFPGDGDSAPAPTVKQPNGPGTLPITFNFGQGSLTEIVTATKATGSINFKMELNDCEIKVGCQGYLYRAADIFLSGSAQAYFLTPPDGAYAFSTSGDGVVLRGGPCPLIGPEVLQIPDPGDSTYCYNVLTPTLQTTGAVFAQEFFTADYHGTSGFAIFTYTPVYF